MLTDSSPHQGPGDTRWIENARRGDLDCFGALVRRHEATIRGYFRVRLRDWAAADDLAQDVFVTAFRRIREFRGDSSFETWLRSIALNHLRNYLRKHREELVGGTEELCEIMDSAAGEAFGGESEGGVLAVLRECLERLDGPARQILEERYVIGRSVREMAQATDRGYSALTMQLHRLRELLADCVRGKLASDL